MNRMIPMRSMVMAAVAVGMLAPLTGLLAGPAAADEVTPLSISLDGVSFTESPEGSIFPADVALVPGSSTSTTIWVRNDSERTGELQLSVSAATASQSGFLESLSMAASTPATAGTSVPLSSADSCSPLLGEALEAGDTATVTITLRMDEAVGNEEQRSTAGADLQVALREPGAPDLDAAGCEPGTGIPVTPDPDDPAAPNTPDNEPALGGLPFTGLTVGLSPWIGVSAVVAGTVIFLISRHRKRVEEE
jgi:hypothetical protein